MSGAFAFIAACMVFLVARRRVFVRRPRLASLLLALPFAKLQLSLDNVHFGKNVAPGSFDHAQARGTELSSLL